jgi:YVTN family beta-propeller protein
MRSRFALSFLFLTITWLVAEDEKPRYAGPTKDGFLLPNGWHLTPVGKHLETSDLPLNIIPLADGKHVLLSTNGFNRHEITVINLDELKVIDKAGVYQSWFGMATDAKKEKVWWSGGGSGQLHTFNLNNGKLERTSEPDVNPAKIKAKDLLKLPDLVKSTKSFRSGLYVDDASSTLYSLDINEGTLLVINLKTNDTKTVDLGGRPYDLIMDRARNLIYVSDWSGKQVLVVSPVELRVLAKIQVGEHPNQIVRHPKDNRIFVACASSNSVSVIDTKRGIVTETIHTSLFPRAPEGSTPDALCVSPDGETLYVANADNNCLAVIDIEDVNRSQVKGFIPTGWYPTAVSMTNDGKNILIGVGKGNQSKPNPFFTPEQIKAKEEDEVKSIVRKLMPYPYIGTTLSGTLSVVPVPDEKQLKEYTAQVYRNCPYSDELLTNAPNKVKTAIPSKVGDTSPIKHVIYIIKENRTYDQVFGDMKIGNGDPSLTMFGEKVTPNHHKIASEFVLLDNLYCNGQVSRDGHPWSTMAYHTDYIARDWHLTYSRRKGVDDDDEGNLSNAPSGYIWDACARAGISYRNYGEYGKRVSDGQGGQKMEGRVPGLIGHTCPNYGISKVKGKRARDTDNVDTFLSEFKEFEKNGNLPKFIVMSMGEDHTDGTTPGSYTPEACVGSNDLALGRLVEAVSKSKYWPEIAIFVIEDDAQNGPDHVDAHRTVGLVISPYTKRKHLDSTQYSTVSLIRTMELILGLSPLSQYDAAARPMFNSFTDKADLTPYESVAAKIDLEKKNTPLSYGADRSLKMDFTEYDRIDDFELNEILWRAVKGKDAPLPPAVRRAIAFRSQVVK